MPCECTETADCYECTYPKSPNHPFPEDCDGHPMSRNRNGSYYCNDCASLIVLFDNDTHCCRTEGTEAP